MPSSDFRNILSTIVKTLDKATSGHAPQSNSSICSAWRDEIVVPTEGPSLTISYRCDGSVSDSKSLSDFEKMLKQSDPITIEVFIFLSPPERLTPDVRVTSTAQVVELVMPHLSRIKRFEVITTFKPTYNDRTLWIRRPLPPLQTGTGLKPFHLLQEIHLQDVSILQASYLQVIFDNAPNVRSAAIYCGEGTINHDDLTPSSLVLSRLETLFVDCKIFDVLVKIGYRLPNLRALAIPTDSNSVKWTKIPESRFPKLVELLVGGLADDQLVAMLYRTPSLKALWLQRCLASSAFVEVLCTKRGEPSCYPMPKLEFLRIEEGSLNDDDLRKLVARRGSPPSGPAARTTATTLYPGTSSTFLLPYPERRIRDLHVVDCPHITKKSGDTTRRGTLGSWHDSRKIGRGESSSGNGAA